MDKFNQRLENFFNPDILKQNLIIASLFIAVFDNFEALKTHLERAFSGSF